MMVKVRQTTADFYENNGVLRLLGISVAPENSQQDLNSRQIMWSLWQIQSRQCNPIKESYGLHTG